MSSVGFLLILFFLCGISADIQNKNGNYRSVMVASDSLICSKVGRDILLKHGSAVDAAIATMLCLGVAIPESMGIGGGFLMTIYKKEEGQVTVLDSREVAPLASTWDMFNGTTSQTGGLSIAVPGSVAGLQEAHMKYGQLPWSELFQPAIELSKHGFPVGKHMAMCIRSVEKNLSEFEELRKLLWNSKEHRLYDEGEIMKNIKLSETLSELARDGAESYYRGKIAGRLVQDIQRAGGIITEEDLQVYRPRWSEPIKLELPGDITMNSFPLPGSGGVLAFILNVMKGYHPKPIESLQDEILFYHRAIETFKFAYARRMGLEDSDEPWVKKLMELLTSESYADFIREKISDNRTFDPTYYEMEEQFSSNTINDHGTSHLSVLAENGDAVAVTTTINLYFGSLVLSPSTGILLNDEMDDFSKPQINDSFLVHVPANRIHPGRRPLSSMVPSIFLDENRDVKLVVGASGGTKITTAVAEICMRTLWLNETINKAINEPRLHNQFEPIITDIDKNFPQDLKEGLRKLGHYLTDEHKMASGVVGIIRGDDGLLYGATDYRKGGGVSGY